MGAAEASVSELSGERAGPKTTAVACYLLGRGEPYEPCRFGPNLSAESIQMARAVGMEG
jgi:hypothetical protein